MRKTILTTLIFVLSASLAFAQETGIRFEKNWEDALAKAKAENKYIFLDCYATWCGPCKWMEANVYSLTTVGDIYNKQFVCVKMQMDKTVTDNVETKYWYGWAEELTNDYTITAYPTFLFFDPDGRPVHKEVGSMDAAAFTVLAANAYNPEKQYYRILKNFQPGSLDTAEEKGLARSLYSTDKKLAGKIALDYLTRIPQSQLSWLNNAQLMVQFQDDPRILAVAIDFINKCSIKENLDFVNAMNKQPGVKQIALNYIGSVSRDAIGEPVNLEFISDYCKEPRAQAIAKAYINSQPEDSLYNTVAKIHFLASYTDTVTDRGFKMFYRRTKQVDKIMNDSYFAQDIVESMIYNAEIREIYNKDKANLTPPDYRAIAEVIGKKYNDYYAKRIKLSMALAWYTFLVFNKKETKYWPQLLQARINKWDNLRMDTVQSFKNFINSYSYQHFFLHCNDPKQLDKVVYWMKELVHKAPHDPDYLDTYACVLYKDGKKEQAIEIEKKALQASIQNKDRKNTTLFNGTIEEMQKGQKIWNDKKRQN